MQAEHPRLAQREFLDRDGLDVQLGLRLGLGQLGLTELFGLLLVEYDCRLGHLLDFIQRLLDGRRIAPGHHG